MKQERELKFNLLCWAQYPSYENKQKRLNPKREILLTYVSEEKKKANQDTFPYLRMIQ